MKKMVVVIWVLCLMASAVLAQTEGWILTPQKLIDFPNGVWNLEFQKGEYYLFQGVLKNSGRISTVESIEISTARDNTFPSGESGGIFTKAHPLQFGSLRALLWRSSIDYQEGKLVSQTTDEAVFKFNPVSLHLGDSIRVMIIGAVYDVSVDCQMSLDVKTVGQNWLGRVDASANQKIYFTKDGAAADLWHQGQFFYLLDSRLLVAWPKNTAPIGQRLCVKQQASDSSVYWATSIVGADGAATFDFGVMQPNCRLIENQRRYTIYRQSQLSKIYVYSNTIRYFQIAEEGLVYLNTRLGELIRSGVTKFKFTIKHDPQYLRLLRVSLKQLGELKFDPSFGTAKVEFKAPVGGALIGGDKAITIAFWPTGAGSSRVDITNFWVYTDKDSLKMFDLAEVLTYSGVFTGISEQQSSPCEYQLAQNYPNPFNGETVIAFQLREPGLTSLNVYNLSGQLVAKLVDQELEAGSHTVKFSSQELPSGMYFYRIQSGTFHATKKFTIMK